MPTPRNGDSAQAAIALVEGVLQVSKPRPVKTEPLTEAVATARLAWAGRRARASGRGERGAPCVAMGATTIARRLPRIGPAGQRCSAEGAAEVDDPAVEPHAGARVRRDPDHPIALRHVDGAARRSGRSARPCRASPAPGRRRREGGEQQEGAEQEIGAQDVCRVRRSQASVIKRVSAPEVAPAG